MSHITVRRSPLPRDRGDTLIEIILTVVITAVAVTALISSLATAGAASTAQRQNVVADSMLRNYAEMAKNAVRRCTGGAPYTVDYTAPAGYVLVVEPQPTVCPQPAQTVVISLTAKTPTGYTQSMQFRVRTP